MLNATLPNKNDTLPKISTLLHIIISQLTLTNIVTNILGGTSSKRLFYFMQMVGVYKDPKGKKIFTKSTSPSVDDLDSIAVIPVREVEHLRKEIRDLTTELDVIKVPSCNS